MLLKALNKKGIALFLEIGKWLLVIWLLLPMRQLLTQKVGFTRVALGILLFIIFSGKLFYDTVLSGIIRRRESSVGKDLVTMVGMVIFLSLLVGLVLFFIGIFIVAYLNTSGENMQEM
ncbi:MAG: hypothetical protein ONB05_03130 [candidate division KSB1 bacterium]|nr:hypothetical protein [candidate division KSB1 bacterium]